MSVMQTSDGGYIITGCNVYNGSSITVTLAFLVKTDSAGNVTWCREIENGVGRSVQQTSDTGYIITGTSGGSDVVLTKTDLSGNVTWSQTFGGISEDVGYSVQQTSDGGYIITGCTKSYGSGKNDIWLIKADSNGNVTWSQTFGGTNNDVGYSVQQTSDGGFILAGYTQSSGSGGKDVWLIKTDANGTEIESSYTLQISELFQNYPNPFNPVTTISYALNQASQVELNVYNLNGQFVQSLVNGKQDKGIHKAEFMSGDLTSGMYIYNLKVDKKAVQSKKMLLLK